ncbi:MAG: PstS family phosphate ABC transporter substrate-binding protein [Alphaproteobacteria bacterium]
MTSKVLTGSIVCAVTVAGAMAAMTGVAAARDQILIVGSSTVFPFSTAVAEKFGQKTDFKTPVVESTGSGGGMKLFCTGTGEGTPDITNASRRIKVREFRNCRANGVTPIEVRIGFDGIVLANARSGADLSLTRKQIFIALARKLPDGKGSLIDNPHKNWSDIDPALPATRIEVLGPPPTSGTRDAFNELVMVNACIDGIDRKGCANIREDGAYIDAGENDNLIVQKLEANPDAVGIFGFSFLDQNTDKIKGATVDGIEPTFELIAAGDYPISRSLFFYIKKEHVGTIPGVLEYASEFTADGAVGEDGYLAEKGLIPLPGADQDANRMNVKNMTPLVM